MKKFYVMLAVMTAMCFAACNRPAAPAESSDVDSTEVVVDSVVVDSVDVEVI